MFEQLNKFERVIYYILVVLLAIVIVFSVFELGWEVINGIVLDTTYRLDNHEMITIFGSSSSSSSPSSCWTPSKLTSRNKRSMWRSSSFSP